MLTAAQIKAINEKHRKSKDYKPPTREMYEKYIADMMKKISDKGIQELCSCAQIIWMHE